MTDAEIQTGLLEAAVRMKKAAPHEWGSFLNALSASAEIDNQNLLSADAGSILHAQGRALAMQQLCLSLANAEQQLAHNAKLQQRALRPRV